MTTKKKASTDDQKKTKDLKSEGSVDRRGFLRSGAAAAGALMLTGAGLAVSAQQPATTAETGIEWDYDVDVLVAGAGNGGMSAGLAAADGGAKTLIVEISTQIGGNSLMSGGIMHTMGKRNWEDYNKFSDGMHDQTLAKVFIETFWDEYVPFLQSYNAHMTDPKPDAADFSGDINLGKGEPGHLRHQRYFDSLVSAFEGLGGDILRKTRIIKLLTNEQGEVIGARARVWENNPKDRNQRIINIRAKKTIMAIGGWIQDGEMKSRHANQDGHIMVSCCGPFSSGEGLDFIKNVGGGMSDGGWTSYSALIYSVTGTTPMNKDMDAMLALWENKPPEEWGEAYSEGRQTPPGWVDTVSLEFGAPSRGILVNSDGKRFVDESNPNLSKYARANNAILNQRRGFAWMIADQKVFDDTPGSQGALDKVIAEGGVLGNHGNVIIADTIEEFADLLNIAGVFKGAFLRTIEEYNAAVDDGSQEMLDVSHTDINGSGGYAIRTGPFYAVPVSAMPYLMYGGARIDKDARVLDQQRIPIPNLYAPPPLGGGIMNEVYMGSIASAGAFGYRSGKHAASEVAAGE